jgi:hypothetical protein
MFLGVLGRPDCFCGVPEIMTNLFLMFYDSVEFLEDLQQLIGILCIERRDAQLSPALAPFSPYTTYSKSLPYE